MPGERREGILPERQERGGRLFEAASCAPTATRKPSFKGSVKPQPCIKETLKDVTGPAGHKDCENHWRTLLGAFVGPASHEAIRPVTHLTHMAHSRDVGLMLGQF